MFIKFPYVWILIKIIIEYSLNLINFCIVFAMAFVVIHKNVLHFYFHKVFFLNNDFYKIYNLI